MVSKYFSYDELWHSEDALRAGIDNKPTEEHLNNMVWLCNNVLDKCREYVGGPLHASFYRSKALNAITPGAAPNSFHSLGMAADINCKRYGHGNNADLFRWMVEALQFSQLIWEFGTTDQPDWIHVTAFAPHKGLIGGQRWDEKKLTRFYWEGGERKKKPFDLSL